MREEAGGAASREVSIRAVAALEAKAVAPLTWTAFRPLLATPDPAARTVCLAAWRGDIPIALAVTAASPEHCLTEGCQSLLSLTVAPAWRRQGVGHRLLTELDSVLAGQGVRAMSTSFSDRLPEAAAFSALLAATGWDAPAAQRYRICGEVKDTAILFRDRDRLLARLATTGFRVHSWRDRAADGNRFAEAVVATGAAPAWARPALWEKTLDPDLSLVIADADGQPAGWVVCEYQPHLTRLYFPIGWMVPPYDARGWLLGAYAVGAERAAAKYGGSTLAVIETGSMQQGMWRLFERHFQPHARWTDRLMVASRNFAGDRP